ncbi:MAG: hypothetical protein ACREFY_13050, partial [Acetobacteraceae bacterium]
MPAGHASSEGRPRYLSDQDAWWPFETLRFVSLQRVPGMTEENDEQDSIDARPTANGDAAADHETTSAQTPPEPGPVPQEARKPAPTRLLLTGALGVAV